MGAIPIDGFVEYIGDGLRETSGFSLEIPGNKILILGMSKGFVYMLRIRKICPPS